METTLKVYKALVWLTLYAASLHFFDNVYYFEEYPEPAWLTAGLVAVLWIPLALLAHRTVDYIYSGKIERSYALAHGFVAGNWLSLGHYLFADPAEIAPRINILIAVQVGLATLLFVMALWLQFTRSRASLHWTGRVWMKNVAMYGLLIFALELVWPSTFSDWWLR